jgi:hypothetical protein
VPGSQVPGAQVPGAQVPGAQVPGAQVPGAQVPGAPVSTPMTQTPAPTNSPTQNQTQQMNQAPVTNQWAPATPSNYVSAGNYSVQVKDGEPQVVQQLLRHMGVQTEHALGQAVKQQDAEQAVQQAKQNLQTLTNQLTNQATQTAAKSANNPLDTFKGTLMQLLSMTEVPNTVKSTVESLVQNITGQQLLLTPDKYGSFSYVTMTIPLFDKQQDGQTAEVHIQSRKGKKGKLDAQNCRLLFDLNMSEMGRTMVDVHVVDRIVNVYVMNDHPAVQMLIETSREEIVQSMESIGYQFLSLKVSEYPENLQELASAEQGEHGAVKVPTNGSQNYRGVDYRV